MDILFTLLPHVHLLLPLAWASMTLLALSSLLLPAIDRLADHGKLLLPPSSTPQAPPPPLPPPRVGVKDSPLTHTSADNASSSPSRKRKIDAAIASISVPPSLPPSSSLPPSLLHRFLNECYVPKYLFWHFYAWSFLWTSILLLYTVFPPFLPPSFPPSPLVSSASFSSNSRLALVLFLFQALRRLYESLLVFSYGEARMHMAGTEPREEGGGRERTRKKGTHEERVRRRPITSRNHPSLSLTLAPCLFFHPLPAYLVGLVHYTLAGLSLVFDPACASTSLPPSPTSYSAFPSFISTWRVMLPLLLFFFASHQQAGVHFALASLRPPRGMQAPLSGPPSRPPPRPPSHVVPSSFHHWSFSWWICPHYFFESLIYLSLLLLCSSSSTTATTRKLDGREGGMNTSVLWMWVWVTANLTVSAAKSQRWYFQNFPKAARKMRRRALLLPGML